MDCTALAKVTVLLNEKSKAEGKRNDRLYGATLEATKFLFDRGKELKRQWND
jgi:hypothetical protein